jgi:hypothetical protein
VRCDFQVVQNEADLFDTIAELVVSSRRSTTAVRLALKKGVNGWTRDERPKTRGEGGVVHSAEQFYPRGFDPWSRFSECVG